MQFIELNDDIGLDVFVEKNNQAYKERSNGIIEYKPLPVNEVKQENVRVFCILDAGEMVSGCCIYRMAEGVARLQHVWTDVSKSRCGYASYLIDCVEKILKEQGYLQLKLGVVSAYLPAYNLYKKKGWKPYALVANQPKTCYIISMVKYLGEKGRFQFECRRRFQYVVSSVKFFLLFKKDSSPKWLYRVIYKKK